MAASSGFVIALFILLITLLAIGYSFGVKTQRLPFTAELEFNEQQWSFLKWWIQVSILVGILLPIILYALCELSKGLNRSLLKSENINTKTLTQQYPQRMTSHFSGNMDT